MRKTKTVAAHESKYIHIPKRLPLTVFLIALNFYICVCTFYCIVTNPMANNSFHWTAPGIILLTGILICWGVIGSFILIPYFLRDE